MIAKKTKNGQFLIGFSFFDSVTKNGYLVFLFETKKTEKRYFRFIITNELRIIQRSPDPTVTMR